MKIKTIPFISVLLLFFISPSCNEPVKKIYVSAEQIIVESDGTKDKPFICIHDALEHIVTVKKKERYRMILLDGTYYLNQPVQISASLSNLEIVAENPRQAILKGSLRVDLQWEKLPDGIWAASFDGLESFDGLFVNGEKQILARYPDFDPTIAHWNGFSADAISPERVKRWKNPVGGFVHASHRAEWGGFHYVIDGVNPDYSLILSGGHQNNRKSEMHSLYRMVENIREELDAPGEWFFDKTERKIYLFPKENVNLNSANIELAYLKNLITISGEEDNPVQNVTVSGIRFEQTGRTFMEKYEPLQRSDWTIFRGGVLFMENAENCIITHCDFSDIGSNVVFVSGYNRNHLITGNHIYNTCASAICFVGFPSAVRSSVFSAVDTEDISIVDTVRGPASNLYPASCVVSENLIHNIGMIEKQVAGVQLSICMKIIILHNSIYDVPRAGINVSEGTWGGHIIEFNDVFNTVLETSDHGSFNSWGRDRYWRSNRPLMDSLVKARPDMPLWDAMHTTIIRNNRFRCDNGWDIDLDDGSTNYHIYNNLCLNGGIKLRDGFYRKAENNMMINGGIHMHVWFENSRDIVTKNLCMTRHQDIRVKDWGDVVDYNFFTEKRDLEYCQGKGIDQNSWWGDPMFTNPASGCFSIKEGSEVLKTEFENFPMDRFGVTMDRLKKMAKIPDIPVLLSSSDAKETVYKWLGAKIKSVDMSERSASGLAKTEGVVVLSVNESTILSNAGLKSDDLIVKFFGQDVVDAPWFLKTVQSNRWMGHAEMTILRNSQEIRLRLPLK